MNALLPWFLLILLCAAPILLLCRGGSRRCGNGTDTGSWWAGVDGGSRNPLDGDGGGGGSD